MFNNFNGNGNDDFNGFDFNNNDDCDCDECTCGEDIDLTQADIDFVDHDLLVENYVDAFAECKSKSELHNLLHVFLNVVGNDVAKRVLYEDIQLKTNALVDLQYGVGE